VFVGVFNPYRVRSLVRMRPLAAVAGGVGGSAAGEWRSARLPEVAPNECCF